MSVWIYSPTVFEYNDARSSVDIPTLFCVDKRENDVSNTYTVNPGQLLFQRLVDCLESFRSCLTDTGDGGDWCASCAVRLFAAKQMARRKQQEPSILGEARAAASPTARASHVLIPWRIVPQCPLDPPAIISSFFQLGDGSSSGRIMQIYQVSGCASA